MNPNPLVTLIVVNYNFEPYVLQTLNSVQQQTYTNMELIVIDDHSSDNSVDLIRKWLETYDRPHHLVLNEKNLGVCATLNKAFHMAKGKYISATAADDLLMPQKLEKQVSLLEAAGEDVCAVYSNAFLVNEHNEKKDVHFIERRNVKGFQQGDIY
jgi:glycosyltransferase involved in cell wall biosynthesis